MVRPTRRHTKKRKTRKGRKTLRTLRILRSHKSKRQHRGGSYEHDVTVGEYEGEPMKTPNTITVAHGGQVMSVTALLNKLNDFILHGPDY